MLMKSEPENFFHRPLYGRRNGPSLGAARRALLEDRLARFGLVSGSLPEKLDPKNIFEGKETIRLEIGFGAGEHLVATALSAPDRGFIGCEHYLAGVASCLSKIDREGVTNAKVFRGDARDLMDALPDDALEMAYLLYPDPWPKTRHHKRRFINAETIASFARILAPKGELRVASDIPAYIDWTEARLADSPDFEAVHQSQEDIVTPWEGWTRTRYEAKALREGRSPAYLRYRRL